MSTKQINQLTSGSPLLENDILIIDRVSTTYKIPVPAYMVIDWTNASSNFLTTGTVNGRDISTDGTKLDGIEELADVTDETNVIAALSGATITSTIVAAGDKVLLQDVDNSDNLKYATTQDIANLFTAGSTTEIIYNNAGSLDGDPNFVTNGAGSVDITGDLDVDNININGNTISITDLNGNLTLTPNGSGYIDLNTDTILVGDGIHHKGDTTNKISFTASAQDFRTSGSSRMDISNSGLRLGGANARVTTIINDSSMATASTTNICTTGSMKTYVDTQLAGASGSPGGSDTQLQYNNAGTFAGLSTLTTDGTLLTSTRGITVDGTADEIQLKIQGHSTQTTNPFEIETSAASNLFTVDNSGNVTVAGTVDGRDIATDGTKLDGIEALADVTDSTNVISSLSGATITSATVATGDKVLIQDADASDALKYVTAQSIADLGGGGGDCVLISSASASSSSTIEFTGFSATYDYYKIIFLNIVPATDATSLNMRTSTNGGSSFDSGASDYGWSSISGNSAGTAVAFNKDQLASELILTGDVPNTSAEGGASGELLLNNPLRTGYFLISGFLISPSASTANAFDGGYFRGIRFDSINNVDAVQFYMSSGNITSGDFYLYGFKNA